MARGKWDKYAAGVRREFRRRATAAGALVTNAVRLELSEPYPPASAPGEAPHLRTGLTRNSYAHRPADTAAEVKEIVGTPVENAPPLEFGAPSIGLEARPHLRPAFEKSRRQVVSLFSAPLPKNLV